ncbi:CRISPR-associated Csd1 family protein (plasmid) [Deinococcus aetherius]|uniref:CRISPR-associated Csd1 family protein n=1 Tax=Deinococcus aetherius TaxID=200252 RepID=A0ABM8AI52_9DEIO|nr:type I-C CRISPR-associated protein Cas8c/Csd1 [Deinococcus aetherius]BDP43476.1 CRISPR-associated Csd1 family protein [Deinococcus aetherius]
MSLLHQLREYELRMRREGKKPVSEGEQPGGDEMPFMYALQPVRWEVRLRGDGTVLDVQPLSSGKTKGKDLGRPTPAPNVVRASGVKSKLLMDNAEYALGIVRKEGDPKVKQRHDAFRALVQACAEATGEPSVQAVAGFLAGHDPASFREKYLAVFPDFAPDTNVTFSVDGVEPLTLPAVQRFWAGQFGQGDAEADGTTLTAECLITGEIGPVMEREPVKIKGILSGQVAGMNFISANAQAFESYGLQASQIAPVKFEAAEQYANGLNRLLADPNTSLKVGGVTYAFWTGEGAVPLVARALQEPPAELKSRFAIQKRREKKARPEEVRQTLWGIFQGEQPTLKPGAAFYAVGLTPSGSRIAVRTHLTSTVQAAVDNLSDYFAAQALVGVREEDAGKTYSVLDLVRAMYRDVNKAHTAPDVDALVQFALSGRPLPEAFLARLAARNRADEYRVTRPRAALTKMVLLSRDWKELDMEKDSLDALDPGQREPAYHLGRLLAVLDDIQGSVMKANTTLVDRFYGSMSTTPYAVVGRLIHGSQAHLQKLRKENEPAYRAKQRELEDVMSRLRDIPAKPLTTAQQALFALGYYHQRAEISAGIRERTEAKREREAQAKAAQNLPTGLFNTQEQVDPQEQGAAQ